jgi:sterol desaturase/sphingolipid hydroxylase (fatty acid hydroxylase superfamily)
MHLGRLNPVVQQFLLLFLFDLWYYWFHRIQHTTALWPQHAIHHSEPHLNAATAFRHHLLENLVKVPLVDIPLMFIFVEAVWGHRGWFTEVATGFVTYLGVFAHSNLRIGFGPLSWVLVSPQTHRIHHSVKARHWNRNFAAYFPVIDVVFGTYYHPRRNEYPDTGIPGVGYQLNSLPAALAHPFREWAAMARDRRARRHIMANPDQPSRG